MMRRCIKLLIVLLFFQSSFAQPPVEKWDLRKCVEYALEHNISVRQADLQIRFAELDLKQSKLAQYPDVNFSTNAGIGSGRNQDPTNFGLITQSYFFNNYSLQAGLDLFNWFTKKNMIAARDLTLKAISAGADKAKNDIALNVAVAYLQILLAREQINLASSKVAQTKLQLESTRKQVDAGKLPELNAVNLESILALDSSTLISAETAAQQSLLQMKALLNLDASTPFDVFTPAADRIPVESLAELQPETVYNLAIANMPQQKVDDWNLKAAQKSVEVARGSMFPTISLFGSLGSGFNSRSKELRSVSFSNDSVGKVVVGPTTYYIYPVEPIASPVFGNMAYFDQLNENFRQSIGIGISVPIMNGGALRTAWQRSKLNVKQVELQKEQNSFTLKQDIYTAYNDATAALQKFNANKKAVDASQKAYDYALKRFDVGLLSTYDLITTQTNLQQAKSQLLYSQYDYLFKIKLLEFYKGQGLKL